MKLVEVEYKYKTGFLKQFKKAKLKKLRLKPVDYTRLNSSYRNGDSSYIVTVYDYYLMENIEILISDIVELNTVGYSTSNEDSTDEATSKVDVHDDGANYSYQSNYEVSNDNSNLNRSSSSSNSSDSSYSSSSSNSSYD